MKIVDGRVVKKTSFLWQDILRLVKGIRPGLLQQQRLQQKHITQKKPQQNEFASYL